MTITLNPLQDADKSAYFAYAGQEEFDDERDTGLIESAANILIPYLCDGGYQPPKGDDGSITLSALQSNVRYAIYEVALALSNGRGDSQAVIFTPSVRSLVRQWIIPVR